MRFNRPERPITDVNVCIGDEGSQKVSSTPPRVISVGTILGPSGLLPLKASSVASPATGRAELSTEVGGQLPEESYRLLYIGLSDQVYAANPLKDRRWARPSVR